jgi:predicted dehydrogenase
MSGRVRIGIVGTGGMGGAHARAYSAIPEAEVAACFDIVPERAKSFADQHGVPKVASDLDSLIGDVDAVAVVTPDKHHAATSLAVLRAGKHLICEKPLTSTLEEAREVATEASRSKVIHMTNFSYRESAAFQRAMALVKEGILGRLRHSHSIYLQCWLSSTVWGSWTAPAMLWRLDARFSGGVLGDLGCHILDMTTGIAGEVKRIRCDLRTFAKEIDGEEMSSFEGNPLDANDTANIELELVDGSVAIVQTTRWATGHKNHLRCEVHGTRGALRLDLDKSYTDLELCVGKDVESADWKTEKNEPTPSNYRRFVEAILKGEPTQPDVLRGAQVQAYLDACERSAQTGAWEPIHPWLI